jgi:hypothetical protein
MEEHKGTIESRALTAAALVDVISNPRVSFTKNQAKRRGPG